MVLIGLLLLAVVFVVLGIVQSSVGWIIASLVASALAAGVMVWSHLQTRKRAGAGEGRSGGPDAPERSGVPAASAQPEPLEPSDGAPRAERSTGTGPDARETVSLTPVSMSKGVDDAPAPVAHRDGDPTVATSDIDVLVIDGQPRYHLSGCSAVIGNGRAEPIPLSQALEDGFVPCPTCTPPRELAGEIGLRPSGEGTGPQVWVVDGHPEFHREGCEQLQGLDDEPIPLSQAVEDGFVPCTVCRPTEDGTGTHLHDDEASAAEAEHDDVSAPASGRETVVLPSEGFAGAPPAEAAQQSAPAGTESRPPSAASGAQVWVADGYPEYHVDGCSELAGLESEPVPYEQAVEDGFQPCVVCNPDRYYGDGATGAPSGSPSATSAEPEPAGAAVPATAVWVVDGFPDYHRQQCPTLVGLGSEAVPHDQAVDDGFSECVTCRPEAPEAPEFAAPDARAAEPVAPAADDVWVVDGFPDYHRQQCPTLVGLDSEAVPHDQAVEDGFSECATCRPEAAEAPSLRTPDEPATTGAPATGGESESQPRSRSQPEPQPAVGEPVRPAEPEREQETIVAAQAPWTAPSEAQAGRTPGPASDVWVVDGHPDYHRPECPVIVGLTPEAVPHDQAVEDGFAECSTCRPEAAEAPSFAPVEGLPAQHAAPAEPEPRPEPEPEQALAPEVHPQPESEVHSEPQPEPFAVAASGPGSSTDRPSDQVWVVDGRPRYHKQDCLIIKAQPATAVPRDQAIEDGFLACSLCQRIH